MRIENGSKEEVKNKILTVPNILSFFRLCLIPVFVWLYCVKRNYLLTGAILIVSGLTDTVDGIIARKFNMVSDLGKVLDPVADKLTQASMLFCLVTRFPLMVLPLALMVVKEIFLGITGLMFVKKTGGVFGAQWHGKAATWLLYAMMILHVFWFDIPENVSGFFIGICIAMMLVSMVLYGRHNIKALVKK